MVLSTLRRFLDEQPSSEITDSTSLSTLLKAVWEVFEGHDQEAMKAWKLDRKLEEVRWHKPLLTFTIERHPQTVHGSGNASLQQWELNLDERTARPSEGRFRRVRPTAKRVDVKGKVDELVVKIVTGQTHDALRWIVPLTEVEVRTGDIYEKESAVKRTLEGRRKRLVTGIEKSLEALGWSRKKNTFFRHN